MDFANYQRCYHHCGRIGHGSGDGSEPDTGCFGRYYRLNDSHGDRSDVGIDSGDAGKPFNCQRYDRSVHGDGNVVGWFHSKFDRHSYLEFGDHDGGDDHSRRVGHGSGDRNERD